MSRISETKEAQSESYYLPHHAVSKQTSTTTKLRVVFDGSAKTSTGISLNDSQKVGPTVQSDLTSILIRFRTHRYVLSADIAKMYRQVLVDSRDIPFQRILWRTDPRSPIDCYELNTVTYGTASTSFLATRVLKQVGLECRSEFPRTSRIIINNFYVDDLLTGTETIENAKEIREEISKILVASGFELRKWASNCLKIADADSDRQFNIDKDPKTLGLKWSPAEDQLSYNVRPSVNKRYTKRTVLSEIAEIYDPLGLIGPIIIRAKLMMQDLWQLRVGWDESLPQGLHTKWTAYRDALERLPDIKIPRCAKISETESIDLHGFADASEEAYGACVYLRTQNTAGVRQVRLLCSKSRVAPLKSLSLPRLELCSALLLARLVQGVKTALNLICENEYYWSDSRVALAWIQGPPNRWQTFVANRVSEIQTLCKDHQWRHVPSGDNPADILSRGTSPSSLRIN
ncbi:PREDICTED: uncharacterized protein LOC108573925 [Habropoda laboriosa]|uniref:uncharacterized protein LOC108573925 n=1 Tax=Habropoda laboriosa TaxID=597456 RepID=UPI00083E1C49|nr:PREDICTED: uncharacterized protein LOC108573925 [Habropoda laboriosa]